MKNHKGTPLPTQASSIQNISMPAIWSDKDSFHMNKWAEELTGFKNEEIPTLIDWFKCVYRDDWETLYYDSYIPAKNSNYDKPEDVVLFHKDGTVRYVRFVGYVAGDSEIWFMTNMTEEKSLIIKSESDIKNLGTAILEIKRLKKKLRQENKKLKKSNQELEDFAYVASHDLKEPLRKIVSFSNRLKEKYGNQLDEKGQFYIERMESASKRLQGLIDDLLKYSRVTKIDAEQEVVDMHAVLDTVLDNLERPITRSKAIVTLDKILPIKANKNLMELLFQNLIHNATKFHEEGSIPQIKISSKIVIIKMKPFVCYTVSDNGIGIEEKYLKRVFNIFEKLHGKDKYPGTGIGLAICQRIVEKHSGEIEIVSTFSEGTTFQIYLPNN